MVNRMAYWRKLIIFLYVILTIKLELGTCVLQDNSDPKSALLGSTSVTIRDDEALLKHLRDGYKGMISENLVDSTHLQKDTHPFYKVEKYNVFAKDINEKMPEHIIVEGHTYQKQSIVINSGVVFSKVGIPLSNPVVGIAASSLHFRMSLVQEDGVIVNNNLHIFGAAPAVPKKGYNTDEEDTLAILGCKLKSNTVEKCWIVGSGNIPNFHRRYKN